VEVVVSKRGVGAGLMLGVYNAVYRTAYTGVYPAVRAGLVGSNWRWSERTGHYAALDHAAGARVWVHAASVGETKAAAILVDGLKARRPGLRVVVSAMTPAGRDTAVKVMPSAEAVVQAPVDLRGPVRRALNWFDPSLLVIVETEIWPNMALECRRRGTKLAVASAKLSSKSYGRYRYIRPLMQYILSNITCVAAQSETDRARLCDLGLDESRVKVTGDVKLDAPAAAAEPPEWLETLVREDDFVFVAGSTRPGEEEIVGKAIVSLPPEAGERLFAVVAPRHMDRCSEVANRLGKLGLSVLRRSAIGSELWHGTRGRRVLLLDSIGELGGVYARSDLAFVGGTLAPFGGHNLVEPASAGVPVVFGPSLESVRHVADALIARDGGRVVGDAPSLADEIAQLSSDSEKKAARGSAAALAIESLRGALGRTLDYLEETGALPDSD
jgi:3-deoxy-D-manno-octulosonic-acid transferase